MEDIEFVPYFVVYRFKDDPGILKCNLFMTLYDLFDFVRSELDNLKCYRVGRCIECYMV